MRAFATVLATAALSALPAAPATAQSARVLMAIDRTEAAVGDTLTLRVEVKAKGGTIDELTLPNLDAFEVIGRSMSRPMQWSFSFGGGGARNVESSSVHEFTLLARAPGTFTLTGPEATVGGRKFVGNSLKLTVHPSPQGGPGGGSASTLPGASSIPAPSPPGASAPDAPGDGRAFLSAEASSARPYVGEPLIVSIRYFAPRPLRSAPQTVLEPALEGFWVQDLMGAQHTVEPTEEIAGGYRYYAYELKRFAAIPLRAGALRIGPMRIVGGGGGMSVFGFGSRPSPVESRPLAIEARPLPPGGPADAVVGEWKLSSSLDRASLPVGGAATLTVSASGTGNLRDVRVSLPALPGLRVLTPTIADQVEVREGALGGTRTFRWILIAEAPGEHTLAPITLATFSPHTGTHTVVEAPALRLAVTGSAPPPAASRAPTDPPSRIAHASPAASIAAFAPLARPSLVRARSPVSASPWFVWALLAPAAAALGGVLGARLWRSRPRRPRTERARSRASNLPRLASAPDAAAFYREATSVLRAGVEAWLGESIGALTHGEVRARLRGAGLGADLTERLVNELDGFDFARFSSGGSSREERTDCVARVCALLDRLEGAPRAVRPEPVDRGTP